MAVATEASLLDCEMSIKTIRLEKEYEKSLADSARLLDAEKDRVRRMEQLLLQFESETLRSQLDRAHEQLLVTTQAESEACLQLDEAYQEIDRLDLHVQSSLKEVEKLKQQGELSTLNNTSTGYNTLLTEKLHLSRDISHFESEIKRLKSQNNSHQALVAEKHEMERQLNSLEIQLENEKHAHERTRAKSTQQATEIDRLSARIDDLQSELTKELHAKQQHERENQQQSVGWESQRSVLEGKVDTLKKQLRSAKDKLQETQQELQQRRINSMSNEGDGTESRSRAVPLQRPGPSADYHSGVTIATPGAVRVKEKSQKPSALPGEKSVFSITPFLNRTGGPTKDSPSSSEAEEDPMDVTLDESNASFRKARAIDEPSGIDAALDDRPGPTQAPPPKARAGKLKTKARDAKPAAPRPTHGSKKSGIEHADMSDDAIDPFIEQGQAKPRKRKLGAQRDRNLFEGDEEEDMLDNRKPGRKVGLGAGRNSVLATTAISSTAAGDRGPRALGFGGFSPLKRDRKRL
ncbi:uncharacterized protein N7443_006797 [Penicillium atrosanguineum]|uniref:uncharacterized protein n=1 Tax=Penicillium atrosanguineum TaxID=1132637 RepID=UPI00239429C7|nr:uncharacterized protein N7443_006797 [Penicillium atrosanguineum]KAJ5298677.1 hypothetical protein N7443_006797 [Penicillium atrosanguineum]